MSIEKNPRLSQAFQIRKKKRWCLQKEFPWYTQQLEKSRLGLTKWSFYVLHWNNVEDFSSTSIWNKSELGYRFITWRQWKGYSPKKSPMLSSRLKLLILQIHQQVLFIAIRRYYLCNKCAAESNHQNSCWTAGEVSVT